MCVLQLPFFAFLSFPLLFSLSYGLTTFTVRCFFTFLSTSFPILLLFLIAAPFFFFKAFFPSYHCCRYCTTVILAITIENLCSSYVPFFSPPSLCAPHPCEC
ncbi:hypothetical protein, unlikely [Trypanosoma brucei gambiense DAL972]|uniref:T. brucei spp.-specific protein n=1 Tax=Trypanosoma brucei gambiense (strain MHOM/CI/86/DAL972) TaxID=679716 RepID=C9ZUK1_TRYB9|nr:hypothetical protein, unlikely [Trypanosoma brucei gambiense DAL972]CBH13089.1 hypothetical protein, unlikely [Trypanosoma brucei gambiense DAL972]|eukprot:XP_011775366.1 hypothetical protein, unlikely [Trypanosoma brucei gambiense DAL972]